MIRSMMVEKYGILLCDYLLTVNPLTSITIVEVFDDNIDYIELGKAPIQEVGYIHSYCDVVKNIVNSDYYINIKMRPVKCVRTDEDFSEVVYINKM